MCMVVFVMVRRPPRSTVCADATRVRCREARRRGGGGGGRCRMGGGEREEGRQDREEEEGEEGVGWGEGRG